MSRTYRSSKHVGRVRLRLAEMIRQEVEKLGVKVRVDPSKLWPNQGYWRIDYRADVMPWEGVVEIQLETGKWQRISVHSWSTMTDCIRGFDIDEEISFIDGIELYPHDPKPHPQAMKT